MVSTTEAVSRLITGDVLLQAERQLLRNREQPGKQPQDQPAQATPAPISHNDKAVASVLLTLLDEQLDASAAVQKEPTGQAATAQSAGGQTTTGPNRVAAQYAEAEAVFRPDLPTSQALPFIDPTNQQILLAASSPELRMAMQSAFLSAAVRAQTEDTAASDADARRRKSASAMTSSSFIRVGAGVFIVGALAIFLAAGFAR
ncbi:hypothetical protein [Hyphomicrobium sp.]|jgi:hypothetical protein|uniref:hypothetical protein n=1 Tax=Hyphomicrobium sp. TaxID=82 RepID=UPI003564A3BF